MRSRGIQPLPRVCAAWLCLVVGSQAVAQTDEDPTLLPQVVVEGQFPNTPLADDTVVTPSRGNASLGQTGSSVTVISGEEIRRSGQTSIAGVLRQVAGVNVVQTSIPGSVTSVFIRGSNAEHTKVLLDGIPLNNPADPNRRFDFGQMNIDNIERIEVVRGPQSIVYGSDAIGGVVNIITKRGDGPTSFRASAMGGSFGTHREAIAVSGGDDRVYYSFSSSYMEMDGFSAVSRRFGTVENDGYRGATFSGRAGWTPSDHLSVDYVFRYTDADVDIDGFVADALERENRTERFFQRVQLQSLLADGLIAQKVGFSSTDHRLLDTDTPATPFVGHLRQVDYQANLRLHEGNTFTAGVDYMHEEGTVGGGPRSQFLSGVYLQDEIALWDRSFTTIGVRWDSHSSAGRAQTYRATQLFDIWETGSKIHGSIGTGFRAPSIDQLFSPFAGNAALRPEFSKGWDVGFEQTFHGGDLVVDVTYFRNDYRDLMQFVSGPFGPGGFGEIRNVLFANSSGIEFAANARLTCDTVLNASYTYTDTEDLTNARRLLRRPRNTVTLSVQHDVCERATVNVYMLYASDRQDLDFTQFPADVATLADYITVNLSGTYRLNDRWQLFGRVDNLTDSDYEEVFSFSTPGISGYAGVNFDW